MKEEGARRQSGAVFTLKEMLGVVLPLTAVTLGVALTLFVLGRLPGVIQKPPPQEYQSVEEAEADLGADILLPVYSPDYLAWLPSVVKIQRQPMLVISQSIPSRREGEGILFIRQVVSREPPPEWFSPLRRVESKTTISFSGKTGILVFGEGEDERWYNELRWREGDSYIFLTMTANYPLTELLRIAGSMRP